MKSIEEKIISSQTSIVRAIFPGSTNHYDTLFGGIALKWMDEVAFITATRFTKKKVVTVSSDRIDFNTPMPSGNFVELIGKVVKTGRTSLVVEVTVFLEEMYSAGRITSVKGSFTFVALDENKKPTQI